MNESRYKCNVCDRDLKSKHILLLHVKTVHNQIKDFECSACDRRYANKLSLDLHIKAVHDKKKDFICEFCDRKFVIEHQKKKHIANVHKSRQIECQFCTKCFTTYKNLIEHIKKIHDEKKFLTCNICCTNMDSTYFVIRHPDPSTITFAMRHLSCQHIILFDFYLSS